MAFRDRFVAVVYRLALGLGFYAGAVQGEKLESVLAYEVVPLLSFGAGYRLIENSIDVCDSWENSVLTHEWVEGVHCGVYPSKLIVLLGIFFAF